MSKWNSTGPAKTAQEVEAEAKERVRSEGGSPEGDGGLVLILSRCKLQFGMYQGQTFKWLLENDLQYAAYIITDSDVEKVAPKKQWQSLPRRGPLIDNKVPFLSHVHYSHCLC